MGAAIIVYTITMGLFAWQQSTQTTCRSAFNSKELQHVSILLSAVFFIGVVGLRDKVGIDYIGYQSYFESQTAETTLSAVHYEPILYFAISAIKFLGLPYQTLVLFFAISQYTLLTVVLKETKAAAAIALFYFLTLSFFESLNTTRQSLALLACIASFLYWRSNKAVSASALIFALTMHLSAAIALPLMLLASFIRFESYPKLITFVFSISVLFANSIADRMLENLQFFGMLPVYQSYYLGTADLFTEVRPDAGLGKYVIYLCDAAVIYAAASGLRVAWTSRELGLIRIFTVGATLNPIVVEANYLPLGRALMYFYGIKFVVYGLVVCLLWKKKDAVNRTLVCGILVIFFIYFYRAILASAAGVSPYDSVIGQLL